VHGQKSFNDGENDSVVTDDSCAIHPIWNASVCAGDVGRLNLSNNRGELPGTVDIETRTARFALLASISGPRPSRWRRSGRSSCSAGAIALGRNGKEFHITGNRHWGAVGQ
jgi:cell migration-inducing and hyaluronan-binding protein